MQFFWVKTSYPIVMHKFSRELKKTSMILRASHDHVPQRSGRLCGLYGAFAGLKQPKNCVHIQELHRRMLLDGKFESPTRMKSLTFFTSVAVHMGL